MKTAGSVLLDTNVVVAHLRNDPALTARLRATAAIYLPWVVLGELHYGALRAQRRETQLALIRDFLRTATVLLPDQSTCERYGQVKAELIPDNDIWIAAMARQFDLPLGSGSCLACGAGWQPARRLAIGASLRGLPTRAQDTILPHKAKLTHYLPLVTRDGHFAAIPALKALTW